MSSTSAVANVTARAPLARIALLIPAWQPGEPLLKLLRELRGAGFGCVLVVDDGSAAASQAVFEALEASGIPVLRHGVNLGKGRALKTGFNAVLTSCPKIDGVVTADADGQHTPEDIVRVGEALAGSIAAGKSQAVLGARGFGVDVPLRSRFGNTLTRSIFGFITGTRLRDTQTGLRGFPRTMLPGLLPLAGERYEYEMTVLAHVCRAGRFQRAARPLELPIETVYIESNRSSHFNPVRDSMRIYFVLARFYASSLLASGVDFAGFSVAYALTHRILLSVAVGRLSSLLNFVLNKGFVFQSRRPLTGALVRYYLLVVAIALMSYELISLLTLRGGWNVFLAKVVVDALLSLVSFSVQRTFIFRRPEDADAEEGSVV